MTVTIDFENNQPILTVVLKTAADMFRYRVLIPDSENLSDGFEQYLKDTVPYECYPASAGTKVVDGEIHMRLLGWSTSTEGHRYDDICVLRAIEDWLIGNASNSYMAEYAVNYGLEFNK